MKLVVVNGSPRKNGNTAAMLKEIAALAERKGMETKYIDLVDLHIADCKGCHLNKRLAPHSHPALSRRLGDMAIFQATDENPNRAKPRPTRTARLPNNHGPSRAVAAAKVTSAACSRQPCP